MSGSEKDQDSNIQYNPIYTIQSYIYNTILPILITNTRYVTDNLWILPWIIG